MSCFVGLLLRVTVAQSTALDPTAAPLPLSPAGSGSFLCSLSTPLEDYHRKTEHQTHLPILHLHPSLQYNLMVGFPSFGRSKTPGGDGNGKFKKMSSGLDGMDFHDGAHPPASFAVPLTPPPNILNAMANAPRMNAKEQQRLQGLNRVNTTLQVTGKPTAVLNDTRWRRIRAWMVNEGMSRFSFEGSRMDH